MIALLHKLCAFFLILLGVAKTTTAFVAVSHSSRQEYSTFLGVASGTSKQSRIPLESKDRKTILNRNGSHFKLDRMRGKVEFGSTAKLVTTLDNADLATVSSWLGDEKRVALSIWDEKLIEERGDSVYRLKLMKLQFVTLQLEPSVDNRMWIEKDENSGVPVFKLQSVDFDPNVQFLPGMSVPASVLGIEIEVVGELFPSSNGKGLEGKIGFLTKGNLTPPMRMLPEPALKSASSIICNTISEFAIQSFQKGARSKYREYVRQNKK